MDDRVKEYANTLKSLAQVPTLATGGCYFPTGDPSVITLQFQQKDLVNKKKVVMQSQFFQRPDTSYARLGFPSEVNDCSLFSLSPSRKFLACIKSLDPADKTKTVLQVWCSGSLVYAIPTTLAKHGPVYNEGIIGGLAWSADEKLIAYVAERKLPENETYFQPETEANQKNTRGKEFEYQSDMGEQYTGKKKADIFVVTLAASTITKVPGVPDDLMPGQLVWAGNNKIIFTGWKLPSAGTRLGFVYCFNRESQIFSLSYGTEKSEESLLCLTGKDKKARSPKLSPDGTTLAYLSTDVVITHNTCCRLVSMKLDADKNPLPDSLKTIVDVVKHVEGDDFPGIYAVSLPARSWVGDFIYITSNWRSNQVVLRVSVSTGRVQRIGVDRRSETQWFLDACPGYLLYSAGQPNKPSSIYCLADGSDHPLLVYSVPSIPQIDKTTWEIVDHKPKNGKGVFETIVLFPETPKNAPFIAYPHGGPHSVYTADFIPTLTFLANLGYAVLLINYRGSTGFGNEDLESLVGTAGTQDVQDCQQAVEEIVERYGFDQSKAFVMGGSHGGFLTCHLIGQYPDYYRAAAARNPVVDFAALLRTSDIPDWTYCHGLGCAPKKFATTEDMARLHAVSPIALVEKTKTPILLALGSLDARVPPQQGLSYNQLLINCGTETKVYLFPKDCHPLDNVDTEADYNINLAKWFEGHMPK